MIWAGKQHPVETLVELLAPAVLALAVGWASWRLGISSIAALALGVAVLIAGFALFRIAGSSRAVPLQRFEPAEFAPPELDELLLEEKDAILELNDPLEEVLPDSRVVRLFARPEPTPGELVDRITDFLGGAQRQESSERQAAEARPVPDASAALHTALASIRASLR